MIWLLYVTAVNSCLSLLRECYLNSREGQMLANIDKSEESAQRAAGRNIRCEQSKQHLFVPAVGWVIWCQSSRDPRNPCVVLDIYLYRSYLHQETFLLFDILSCWGEGKSMFIFHFYGYISIKQQGEEKGLQWFLFLQCDGSHPYS